MHPIKILLASLILFLLQADVLFSQSTFVRYIGANSSDYGNCVIATSDGGYALAMLIALNPPVNDSTGAVLVKTDCYGDIEWSKTILAEQVNVAYKVIETNDGGFLVQLVTSIGFNPTRVSLAKLNSTGNLIWCRQYPLRGGLMDGVVTDASGNIFLLGNASLTPGGYDAIGLMKLNPDGNLIWAKEYSFTYGCKPIDIALIGDKCVVGASITLPGNSFTDAVIMITDASGNQLNTIVAGTLYDDELNDLDTDGAGNIFICGRSFFLNQAWDGMYMRFDENMNLLNSAFYDAATSDGENFRERLYHSNGVQYFFGDEGTFDDRNLMVTKADFQGNMNWCKSYELFPAFTNYALSSCLANSDEPGMMVTGDVRTAAHLRDALFMKIDSSGNAPCLDQPLNVTVTNPVVSVIDTLFSESILSGNILNMNPVVLDNMVFADTRCTDQLPCAAFIYQQDSLCPACVSFTDLSAGNTSTSWNIIGTDTLIVSNEINPVICFDKPGDYRVTILASNTAGTASSSKTIVVDEDCPLFIPNIFTPNNDNVNDIFFIKELPEKFNLKIFNRWGMNVFETSDVENFWNGENKSGNLVSAGVYYYLLSLPEDKKEMKGWVEVRY